MTPTLTLVLSTTAVLLLLPWVPSCFCGELSRECSLPPNGYSFNLTVYNSLSNSPNLTYTPLVAYRGVLLGAMKRLSRCSNNFTFNTTDNIDYGAYLESVNGVFGTNRTYWELLVQRNGSVFRSDVGVGCLIPENGDRVILKYTSW